MVEDHFMCGTLHHDHIAPAALIAVGIGDASSATWPRPRAARGISALPHHARRTAAGVSTRCIWPKTPAQSVGPSRSHGCGMHQRVRCLLVSAPRAEGVSAYRRALTKLS